MSEDIFKAFKPKRPKRGDAGTVSISEDDVSELAALGKTGEQAAALLQRGMKLASEIRDLLIDETGDLPDAQQKTTVIMAATIIAYHHLRTSTEKLPAGAAPRDLWDGLDKHIGNGIEVEIPEDKEPTGMTREEMRKAVSDAVAAARAKRRAKGK